MTKIIRKSESYSIEKVQERILYYEKRMEELKDEAQITINAKLLSFWIQYKHKNYSHAKAKS